MAGNNGLFVNTSHGVITITQCIELPATVHSQGLWSYMYSGPTPSMPLIELEMIVIFTITQASHFLLKRFGVPKFTTQLLVRDLFHFLVSLSLICTYLHTYIYDQILCELICRLA